MLLFEVGFLTVRIWDILDIMLVGYLIFRIYKLLKANVAFNIFFGIFLIYVAAWLVKLFRMDMLSFLLGQFVNVGVIVIAIVFQPEIRRFLLYIGNSGLKKRFGFLDKLLFFREESSTRPEIQDEISEIKNALLELSRSQTGALIILANHLPKQPFTATGVQMNAQISKQVIISIFNKESPLHDGAMVISNYQISAASCILPVTDNPNLPQEAGLRHRAAVGVSEYADVVVLVVSEETGRISIAQNGRLFLDIDEQKLESDLLKYYK